MAAEIVVQLCNLIFVHRSVIISMNEKTKKGRIVSLIHNFISVRGNYSIRFFNNEFLLTKSSVD